MKVVIANANEEGISHNIFYTAVTRARTELKIYWSPETQKAVLEKLEHLLFLGGRHSCVPRALGGGVGGPDENHDVADIYNKNGRRPLRRSGDRLFARSRTYLGRIKGDYFFDPSGRYGHHRRRPRRVSLDALGSDLKSVSLGEPCGLGMNAGPKVSLVGGLPLSAGGDLVTRLARERDPVRAVVELVWNAIDAEADSVRVELARTNRRGRSPS